MRKFEDAKISLVDGSNVESQIHLLENGWVYIEEREAYVPPSRVKSIDINS